MRKFLTRRNIIILVVILAAVGIWRWRAASSQDASKQGREVTVTRENISEVVETSGKIVSDKTAALNFQVSGKISYVNTAEGKTTKAGQVLLSIDTGELKISERGAYYKYLAADANAKQVEDEVKDHNSDETFVMKNKRVSAQTARDMAYDGWLLAQKNLQDAYLVSPFAGVVSTMTVDAVGDTVSVTDGVTVVDPEHMHFEAEVDEAEVAKIKLGQSVEVKLDAFGDKKFVGQVSSIGFSSRISSSGATVFPLSVSIVAGEEVLRIGMNGDGDILIEEHKNALVLPVEAVEDGKVTLTDRTTKSVKTGIEGISRVEVTEGLNEGDKVVVK